MGSEYGLLCELLLSMYAVRNLLGIALVRILFPVLGDLVAFF